MSTKRIPWIARLLPAASCVLLLVACGPGGDDVAQGSMDMEDTDTGSTAEGERQEFAFTGTVQGVDTVTRIVSVANDEIPGWMMAMTMNYFVEPAEVLQTLEPGDQIRATVYSGDFQHLYEVEILQEP